MKKAVFISALALALAACGGGGSGDSSGSSSSSSSPGGGNGNSGGTGTSGVVATTGTLKTSAAAPSYAASSQQASFFSALNTMRAAAGAGCVDQSTAIDAASQGHADYLTANITTTTDLHSEDSTKAAYYADTVAARLTKGGCH